MAKIRSIAAVIATVTAVAGFAPRRRPTTGVHVDRARGRVLAAYADVGLGLRTSPGINGQVSGVGIFDLATGRLATELTVDERGNAYVTDSASGTIHRVDPHGRASVLVPRQAVPPRSSASAGSCGIPTGTCSR